MAETPPGPASTGSPIKKLATWAKKNKLLAAGIGGGGVLLFMSARGGGAADSPAAEGDAQFGQLVPVMQATDETGDNSGDYEDTPLAPDTPLPPEPDLPSDPAPAPAAPTPAPQPAGITVNGKFFAGATSSHLVKSQSVPGGGSYHIYSLQYPGRVDYWWHYTSGPNAGQWTGPHRPPGSGPRSPATAPAPKPKPAAKPKPQVSQGRTWPDPGGTARNLAWWQNATHNRKNGKWRWPGGGGFVHSRRFEGK